MNTDSIYDILISVFSTNVNFDILFEHVEEPFKSEIINFIEFLKKNPSKDEFRKYAITDTSKKYILNLVNDVLNKTKKN